MTLSIGEIVSISIAILFGVLNIIQYYNKRNTFKPITNSLIGLFNDVKDKLILCHGQKNKLWNPDYPHKEAMAVRWDYDDFIFSMIESLYGFQEHIVALLNTMDIKDKDIFKAVDFGLSSEEKEQRELFLKKIKEMQEKQTKGERVR